jgi:hypothetical protein
MKIRIKEAEEIKQDDQLLSQLKDEMSDLIGDIEDTLKDKSKEQKEGVLTTAGVILAVPAVLGLIAKFGKSATKLFKKIVGEKPNDKKELEQYFARLGKLADNLHHLYMKPLEILMSKFIKDPTKAKKVANFIFHVIVAILFLSAGITAFKAIQSKNISLATLEAALASVKGGEIKNYIAKLIA